ncbi:GntR family transcriptional regulator [Lachnospiraceae bacterium OF09-33XD]|nr:GntR family transcriptional regulator [Lachnospiraceae bacterium OF09-33XD]
MDINTNSLAEQFANLILEMIMNKELTSGQQIPTKEIAQNYGVSAMPVRQALRELCDKKLVVNKARVGYFVASYTPEELIQISSCRRMFEMYCLDNFFDSLDLEKLHELYQRIQQNTGDHFDNLQYQKDDAALHSSFVKASKNPYLLDHYNQIKDLFSLCIIYDDNMEDNYLSRAEHLRLLEYIFARKKSIALLELKNHLDRVDRTIMMIGKNIT